MFKIGGNTWRRTLIMSFSRSHKIHICNICKSLNDTPTREIHTFSFVWPNPEKGLFMKTPPVPLRIGETCRKISSQASICCLRRLLSYLPVKFRSRLILLLLQCFKLQFKSVDVSLLKVWPSLEFPRELAALVCGLFRVWWQRWMSKNYYVVNGYNNKTLYELYVIMCFSVKPGHHFK